MLTAKNCKASTAVQYFTDYYDSAADGIALRLPSGDTSRFARLQRAFHQAEPTLLFETLRERERGQTRWFGKGASALGLEGEIDRGEFENVCYGKSPNGTKYLGTKGDPEKRRAGTDFTFSAPKSVSLSAFVSGDTRLEVAHRVAVEKTLALIEARYAQTRITNNKNVVEVKTSNLVVAQFDHIESRELDPHLHTHALVMNLTQAESGKWYANDNDLIFGNKKHLGTIYQTYLAAEVEKLGYGIEYRPHGQFEIAGYDREHLEEFQ